ncbi:hypothetical protein [Hymenobacter arizonensis]|uniref:Uncharacterized protein n=1 Tax=Hymenobacter arizonensis TaxID=1227077 RepID=A0A1I6BP55_HYMAR|nr:hypothetical protein [Hymenobacter arizonensis]SFQ82706.1 hypothetical protein SAMN04515668_4869 [Hymenobacter arizonensis]
MGQRKCLNEKRLTKKQVQALVEKEGQLHKEYTAFFQETYASGHVQRDLVYELPDDRFLYVFDQLDLSIPGKGDVYAKAYFLKWMQSVQRVRDNYANNRGSSVDHWRFYSHCQNTLIERLPELADELARVLQIDRVLLDKSYASLDLVSTACEALGLDTVFKQLYDPVVAYVGEVIRQRVNGWWELNATHYGGNYPFISVGLDRVQYMPINVAWTAMQGMDPIDFRKEAANEVRLRASSVKFERKRIARGIG